MPTTRQTSRIAVAITLSTLSLASTALASWPTTPGDPLVLGSALSMQASRPGIVATQASANWVAWIDGICDGTLRMQRIGANGTLFTPGGFVVGTLPLCHSHDVLLADCTDGSAVVCLDSANPEPLDEIRAYRVAADGSAMWGDGVTLDMAGSGRIGALVAVADGDAIVIWLVGASMIAQRFDAAGDPVWPEPAVLTTTTSNFRLNAAIADEDGGLMLVWDHPAASYFRRIVATKVTPEGAAAWPAEVVYVTPTHPFASRHTRHSIVSDGEGGVWITYSRGGQQSDTPVPIDVQRVHADGTIAFATPHRVSLDTQLQFEPHSWRDAATGDLVIGWRDGSFASQTLRAQRLTPSGERLFGDHGVMVDSVLPTGIAGLFTGHWTGSELLLTYANTPAPDGATVRMTSIDGDGVIKAMPSLISGPEPAFSLRSAAHGDDQVIMWMLQEGTTQMKVVAHLVHADGSLGTPAHPADINGDGAIDGADLAVLLGAWGACPGSPCIADPNHDGQVDGSDLAILLGAWTG